MFNHFYGYTVHASWLSKTYIFHSVDEEKFLSEVIGRNHIVNYAFLTAAKEIHCKKQNSFLENRLVLPDN